MAWCHQATSHYLNQSWPRSLSPYGVTSPQWVDLFRCCCILKFRTEHSGDTFKMNGHLRLMLWMNAILQDFSLRWVLDRYPILHSPLGKQIQRNSFQTSWVNGTPTSKVTHPDKYCLYPACIWCLTFIFLVSWQLADLFLTCGWLKTWDRKGQGPGQGQNWWPNLNLNQFVLFSITCKQEETSLKWFDNHFQISCKLTSTGDIWCRFIIE